LFSKRNWVITATAASAEDRRALVVVLGIHEQRVTCVQRRQVVQITSFFSCDS
jgi:hypothetical protein